MATEQQEHTDHKPRRLEKRHDMTWHDHLIMLLHIGASIEHALMVQYLYAAYSLGGEQVPKEHWPMVRQWQETILAVAREEMGHLLTVQNILTLMGAGINLNRENFPWDIAYYPFPFVLEPFTRGSLACYVYAEMPEGEQFPEKEEITKLATADAEKSAAKSGIPFKLHAVGEIYTEIIELVRDTKRIPDSAFKEETLLMQASWDDWGRGYQPRPRPLDANGNLLEASEESRVKAQFEAHVIIDQVATRTQALQALIKISVQGEGPHRPEADAEWSHFKRFIKVFKEFEQIRDEPWEPARPVPRNPTTVKASPGCYISSSRSRDWAELFNLRYRLLLTLLSHTFRLARTTRPDEPSVRAVVMHRVFAEMYNIKTLSGILVQQPLHDTHDPDMPEHQIPRAGPPFEMPYNLRLPPGEADTWRLYLDVLGSADKICKVILSKDPSPENRHYLEALFDLDNQTREWLNKVLAGLEATERYS